MTEKEIEKRSEEYFLGLDNGVFPYNGCPAWAQRAIRQAYSDGLRSIESRWNDDFREMNPLKSDVLVENSDGNIEVWLSSYLWGKTTLELMEQHPNAVRWMWAKDLPRP